ncbi:UNVERIFIED_CONTAM: Retrovirus-related Pol polyprotein from transposon RE1 [Sesamum radiatum]|uniref:Retrovirus-related Pol polyprotein from transposon RE1 n=1 Tax=Sesamum radiatum TaxID=300843 RepID=A0AAW2K0E6_SESRA
MAGKNAEGGGTSIEEKMTGWPEKLKLHGGDHPGMSLVSVPLDGSNYLSWSRSVKLALGAKQKLGFIDGTCGKPTENKAELEQWQRVDCMVVSWLLNSISKDIAEAFLYTTSAQDLWEELATRFGESNGPMLYDIQKLIASLVQGRAYSMLLRIEKQREVHIGSSQDGAMNARFLNQERQGMNEIGQRRRGQMDKRLQYCNHCKRNGHTRESCFKLKGYPEWYKNLMDQRKNAGGSTSRAYNVDVEGSSQRSVSVIESDLSNLVRLEIRRAMQEHTNTLEHDTNLVALEDFAGNAFTFFDQNITSKEPWIIDSGASTHMCSDFSLLNNVRRLRQSVFVKLPDGTRKEVTHKGDIQLTEGIKLNEVLHIPSFRHNLLSVSKVCLDNSLKVSFTHNECILQDLQTQKIMGVDCQELACPLPLVNIESEDNIQEPLKSDVTVIADPEISSPLAQSYQQRRSTRLTSKPAWMNDFVCSFSTNTKPGHIITVAPSHRCFVDCLSVIQEPSSFSEAQQKEEWKQAMQLEVQALEKNGTWDLVKAPTDKKPIGCRWIYKLKLKPNGSIERYKARLVAKGYNQVEGEDYTDCFAPVAKAVTVRIFLAVAVSKGWPIHHLDVNNAFLHGSLKEDIYMDPPEVTAPSEFCIQEVKEYLHDLFTIKDLGIAKYFLGIELARSSQGLLATQTKYISNIVRDAGLTQAKATNTPLPAGVKFTSDSGALLSDPSKYRRLGRLFGYKEVVNWFLYIFGPCSHFLENEKASNGYLLQDLGISLQKPIPLFCDNKAAVHITANPVFHERTKHLEIDCHIVRDKFKEGYVIPTHISAKEQIADILTKPLTGPAFQFLKSKLNLYSLPPSLTCGGDVKMDENAKTELVEGVT